MKMYLSIIGTAMLIIASVNIALGLASWYYAIIAVIWCVTLQFALDGLIAIAINRMPNKWFSPDNPAYNVSKTEKKIYLSLGVRAWKDRVWELGGLGGFSKKQLKEPSNPKYIERFIIECNKGVLTHRLSYFIGFLAMLTLPGIYSLSIALPVAAVNLFLNVLPTVALRYNTPMLISQLKRLNERKTIQIN